MDVHQATISVAVMDSAGKLILESILETKAATILQFIGGLHGSLLVTFEEGTKGTEEQARAKPLERSRGISANSGLDIETKNFSAAGRRRSFFVDIPFDRTTYLVLRWVVGSGFINPGWAIPAVPEKRISSDFCDCLVQCRWLVFELREISKLAPTIRVFGRTSSSTDC
jgi:hypothetical protein